MKRIILCALLLASLFALSACEGIPGLASPTVEPTQIPTASPSPTPTAEPTPEPTPTSRLPQPDPTPAGETPIPVDPIDKPTATPAPTPNYEYVTRSSSSNGVSFAVPGMWILDPNTDESEVRYVEPQEEMHDGYQTRLTFEKYSGGSDQKKEDAQGLLEELLDQMASDEGYREFTPGGAIGDAQLGGASGVYSYYRAVLNDGTAVRGRITVVAYGRSLYQLRITAPANWYTYYEYVFRKARSTFKFY